MNGTLDFLGENEFTRIDADKRPVVRTRCQGAPVISSARSACWARRRSWSEGRACRRETTRRARKSA